MKVKELKNGQLMIEDARLIWRNFSGLPDRFNPKGENSNFNIVIDAELVDNLRNAGWNVKERVSKTDPDDILYYMQVKVKYGKIAPRAVLICGEHKTNLDKSTIGLLDTAQLINTDLIVRPWDWNINGDSGRAAYMKTIYATIEEDPLAAKYSDYIGDDADEEDDVPW